MVVDFAVVDDADGPVLIAHRLLATRDVDDGQPCVRKADRAVDQVTLAIGTPVDEDVAHAQQSRSVDWNNRIVVEDAGNAAHGGDRVGGRRLAPYISIVVTPA